MHGLPVPFMMGQQDLKIVQYLRCLTFFAIQSYSTSGDLCNCDTELIEQAALCEAKPSKINQETS